MKEMMCSLNGYDIVVATTMHTDKKGIYQSSDTLTYILASALITYNFTNSPDYRKLQIINGN